MNVLVYTGPGAGKGPIEQTIGTLRLHLSDSYDIISVDAATLLKEPWQATTKLLVLPGGRDLPYVEQLSPKVTSLIRDWVANDGGSFLGICAGAYFASRQVDFEPDRPSYKVVGERDLRFFDGSARGSIADGFIYNSEMGSKNCSITLDKPALGLDFDSLQVYVNGGPYFDLESLLPESPQPTVLAEYDPKDVSDKWKADSAQNKRYPAILECAIGRGKAILTGPHIEYQMRPLGSALAAKPGSEAIEWRDAVVSGLLPFEKQRSRLFRELLIRLGLNTNIRPERSDLDTSHDEPPKLTPMFLCFQPSPHVNVEDKIAQIRRPFDAAARSPNEPCVLEDDVNRLVLEDRQQDQYSDTMPVLECEQDDRPHKSVVKLCVCRDLSQIPRRDLLQFNIDRYLGYLKEYQDHWTKKQRWLEGTWKCGSVMLYGDIVESTQTLLDRNYKFSQSLPEGLVCVGSHQTAGRGRGRNSWISQSGCLQFSLALRHNDHKSIIFIQYLFGLAVVQALKSQSGYEELPVHLKWPNDIYARVGPGPEGLKKIGGILVNSSYQSGKFSLVVGCGLNVSNTKPTLSVNQLINSLPGQPEPYTTDRVLALILATFENLYHEFVAAGLTVKSDLDFFDQTGYRSAFEPFQPAYYRAWLHSNQLVTLKEHGVSAKIVGIDSSGLLRAVVVDGPNKGQEHRLQPDGNSFDMMHGLIMVKK